MFMVKKSGFILNKQSGEHLDKMKFGYTYA